MASATENRLINLYINGQQAGKTLSEIRQKYLRLSAEINRGELSQQEYNQKLKQLRGYGKILDDHRQKVRGVSKSWDTFKGVAMGVVGGNVLLAAFQKITNFIPDLIQRNAELSDSFADVRKTTGLTEEGMAALNGQLKLIDTRTPRKRLLELARDAGKLGITGVSNITGFVKAADQINVSLGEDLGEDAIRQIGKLNNLFKSSELFGYEQGMLKIGSVINELGANSEAAEASIVDFTSRLAGISTQAGITIDEIAAYGATLDSIGQRTETSATAINQAIVGMYDDTATYAKIAGVGVQEFTNLLETDANEAFITFLDGLNGNNEGLGVLTQKFDELGLDGSRAIQVMSALASNTKNLREQQRLANRAFEEGISLTNEFNIKNNNLAGDLAKIGKRLSAIWVSSGLNKAIGQTVSWFKDIIELPVDKELKDQQRAANSLIFEIVRLNQGSQERIDKIKQLKAEYPAFTEFIDEESVSNRELLDLLRKINSEYAKKIFLANKQEDLDEIGSRLTDATAEEDEKLQEVEDARIELLEDATDKQRDLFLRRQDQIEEFYNNVQASGESHVKKVMFIQGQLEKNGLGGLSQSALTSFMQRMKEYRQLQDERLAIENEYNQELAKIQRMADRLRTGSATLGDTGSETNPDGGTTTTTTTTGTTTGKSAYEKATEAIRMAMEQEALYLEQHRAEQLIEAELFEEEMLGIKLTYLLMQKEAAQRFGEETVSIEREMAQTEIQLMEMKMAAREKEQQQKDKIAKANEDRAKREAEVQQQAAMAAVESAFMRGSATAENARNEYEAAVSIMQTLRGVIKEQINAAIAKVLAEQLITLGPAGIITGALAGAAVSALFDSLIPPIDLPPPPAFAEGTAFFGGSAIVGDQGREQVNLPLGSSVIPADLTQQILAANAFSKPTPQPSFSAINDGLTYTQSQQQLASGQGVQGGSIDLTPLLAKLDSLERTMAAQGNKRVVLTQRDQEEFNERLERGTSRVRITQN